MIAVLGPAVNAQILKGVVVLQPQTGLEPMLLSHEFTCLLIGRRLGLMRFIGVRDGLCKKKSLENEDADGHADE